MFHCFTLFYQDGNSKQVLTTVTTQNRFCIIHFGSSQTFYGIISQWCEIQHAVISLRFIQEPHLAVHLPLMLLLLGRFYSKAICSRRHSLHVAFMLIDLSSLFNFHAWHEIRTYPRKGAQDQLPNGCGVASCKALIGLDSFQWWLDSTLVRFPSRLADNPSTPTTPPRADHSSCSHLQGGRKPPMSPKSRAQEQRVLHVDQLATSSKQTCIYKHLYADHLDSGVALSGWSHIAYYYIWDHKIRYPNLATLHFHQETSFLSRKH